jgi:malate dehydrogenase
LLQSVAVLGAGDLGATLARRIAEQELARRVVLVDPDEGKAKGKALDLMQSGPVEAYDVTIEGAAQLDGAKTWDAVLFADPADLPDAEAVARAREILPLLASSPDTIVLVTGNRPAALVEALTSQGLKRDRVLGTASLAVAGALRRHLAHDLEAQPREVCLTVLGAPPDLVVVPRGSVSISGLPVELLSPVALRRALAAVGARSLGPVALAAAGARVLDALSGSAVSVLPVVTRLEGEYGHRGPVVAVPARLGHGRLHSVVEVPLDPVERVAFDNAAERSVAGGQRRGFRAD